MELLPHRHSDGTYVASHTRFKADYIRVESENELEALVRAGYGVRMSNSKIRRPASLISSGSIVFGTKPDEAVTTRTVLPKIIESAELDRDSQSKARKEQNFLRAHLLASEGASSCTLCGRELPEPLFVAAHIKKRAECSLTEKLDFDHVATLMCRLGCDELFERGYVVVVGGTIKKNASRHHAAASEAAVAALEGKSVENWPGSKVYYEWHAKYHK